MKWNKFSEAQIAFVLKQTEDGTPLGEVCRKAGIKEATYYHHRKKYVALMPSEMRRCATSTAKLKRVVADFIPGKVILKDVISRNLSGLIDAASWSMMLAALGRSVSGGSAPGGRSSYHYPGMGAEG